MFTAGGMCGGTVPLKNRSYLLQLVVDWNTFFDERIKLDGWLKSKLVEESG